MSHEDLVSTDSDREELPDSAGAIAPGIKTRWKHAFDPHSIVDLSL